MKRPLVVGHRGASGHRPENTLAAFELAYRQGADALELDVVSTRDGVLVCRHDLDLATTTDVSQRPEFAHLRRLTTHGEDWSVNDFTFDELRRLRCMERWPKMRRGSASFDRRFTIPRLQEVVDLTDKLSVRQGRDLHIFAELKKIGVQRARGLDLIGLANQIPAHRITWISFEHDPLLELAQGRHHRIGHLYNEYPTIGQLGRSASEAIGVGVRTRTILRRDETDSVSQATGLVEVAHDLNLQVWAWSLRAENKYLPKNLRFSRAPYSHGDAVGEATMLLAAGVDGVMSDHPETAAAARATRAQRKILAGFS